MEMKKAWERTWAVQGLKDETSEKKEAWTVEEEGLLEKEKVGAVGR